MPSAAVLHATLDGHQVGFLCCQRFVDFRNKAIGQLLHVVLGAAFFVFGDFLVS